MLKKETVPAYGVIYNPHKDPSCRIETTVLKAEISKNTVRALTVTDQKVVDKKGRVITVMKDLMALTKEEFEVKWPYEVLHWRRKLMEWEASMTMRSEVWDGELK